MLGRFLVLIVLLVLAGVAIWAAVTNQRIELIEDTTLEELELDPMETSDGTFLNLVREGEGAVPLVLIHDVDVAGSVIWDGVVAVLDPKFDVMRIDLPGYGLSERIPVEGRRHTVASMAVGVAETIVQSFDQPALIAGVGLGGEVGAEIAVINPELVAGLVMIDVDFYKPNGWVELVEKLPWVGTAATFTVETTGPLAARRWAPYCGEGGWCPTRSQVEARNLAGTIVGTTDSIRAFRRTPAASLVPSKLSEIAAPVHYLWSQQGDVPRGSVDRVQEALPDAELNVLAEAWRSHLDYPQDVAAAITSMAP